MPIQHFSDDVWLDSQIFHCRNQEYPLGEIERIYINFRVNTAIFSFLMLLACFAGLLYGYFNFGSSGYFMFVPLVACFALLRYTLLNYVELWIIRNGKPCRIIVSPMRRREWVYNIEDAIIAQMQVVKAEADTAK